MNKLNLVTVFLSIKNGEWNIENFENWIEDFKNQEFIRGYKKAKLDQLDEFYIDFPEKN